MNRTPTALLKLRGSWRGKYRVDAALEQSIPARPAWLCAAAAREWDRIVPQLARLGILNVADGWALARYVETLIQWREISRIIARDGPVQERIVASTGATRRVARPEVAMLKRLDGELLKTERAFAMTPRSRAGMKGAP